MSAPQREEPSVAPPGQQRTTRGLVDVALSINSAVEPAEAFEMVVQVARELLDADRATILLLDARGRLLPQISVARAADVELWRRFRDMEPIPAVDGSLTRVLLERGRAVRIDDASQSPIVPPAWARAFRLTHVAVAPLVVKGEICGALAVDNHLRSHRFDDAALTMLEGVAALAAVTVRNAQDRTTARAHADLQRQLLELAVDLGRELDRRTVLDISTDGFCRIFGARACTVNICEGASAYPLATHSSAQSGPAFATGLSPEQVIEVRGRWAAGRARPVVLGETTVVFPVGEPDRVEGFVVLCDAPGPWSGSDRLRLGALLAEQVWQAERRAKSHERTRHRLHCLEALYQLAQEIALLPQMRLVLERLAPVVREATGVELIDVRLRDRAAARLFETATTRGNLTRVLRRWRGRAAPRPEPVDGLYAVPLLVNTELVGVMQVRPTSASLPAEDQDFLLAVGAEIAEVVSRAVLRSRVEAGERELAVAEERHRIAGDLHESVARLLVRAHQLLRPLLDVPGDPALRPPLREGIALVGQAVNHTRESVRSLALLPSNSSGLPSALRRLVSEWAAGCGTAAVTVRVRGPQFPLSATDESALLRVAHESLTRLQAFSRADVIRVELVYGDEQVQLEIWDNGVGLAQRAMTPTAGLTSIRTMTMRMQEIGGRLEVSEPKVGLLVLATLGVGSRRRPLPPPPARPGTVSQLPA